MLSTALAAAPTKDETAGEKGRVEKARVRRYRAGAVPEYAREQVAELSIQDRGEAVRTDIAAPVIVKKADPRLARLAQTRTDDLDARLEERREIRAAEVVRRRVKEEEESEELSEDEGPRARRREASSEEPGSEEPAEAPSRRGDHVTSDAEEDEEEAARRRQAVRERLMQQQRAAEAAQQIKQEEESEESEEESEYETDSEDETYGRKLLKPVFVPKTARDTIAERDRLEQEEEEMRQNEKKREEERKLETREVIKTVIQAEEAAAKAAAEEAARGTAHIDDVDTDEDEDETVEFEAWKLREMARIKRYRDAVEKQVQEAVERERLKNMTDEERRVWEAANPKQAPVKDKKKWKFLQKYWHKGAFFQEGADDDRGTTDKDEIFTRDYSAPTGEDKFNKEMLPKVMQVRNFGRSGRTKWTHLLAEDTTQAAEGAPLLPASADRKRYGIPQQDFVKPKKFKT